MPRKSHPSDSRPDAAHFTMLTGKRVRSQSAMGGNPDGVHQTGFAQLEDKPSELLHKASSTSGSVTSSARHLSNCTVTTLNKE